MICQVCGVEAPTKYVEFYQNIGALVMRFHKQMKGNLCKSCISEYFWQYTLITLVGGWWGVISFFMTPIFLVNNIVRYIGALGLDPVPPGASPPQLTEDAVRRLQSYTNEIVTRLNSGEKLEQVAQFIAPQAGVTPGQVGLYVAALARSAKQQS